MKTASMVVALLCCVGMVAGNVESELLQIWSTNEQEMQQDVQELANTLWGLVCPNCDSPTTPSEQHNRTLDHGLVFNVDENFAGVVEGILSGMGDVARVDFIDVVADNVGNDIPNDFWSQIMKSNFNQMQIAFTNYFEAMADNWNDGQPNTNATVSGGGGMGFGVQFDCNGQTLVSLGGGAGAGWSGNQYNTTGGSGGGGGMIIQTNGAVISQTGGGGGGGVYMLTGNNFIPSWGTSVDPNQKIGSNIFQDISATASACYTSGQLTMRASGGGGAGILAVPPTPISPSDDAPPSDDGPALEAVEGALLSFGGGFGFQFTYASPTGSGVDTTPDRGLALGHVSTQCRNECLAAGTHFYACFCPCIKTGFAGIPGGAPWAQFIVCNTPS